MLFLYHNNDGKFEGLLANYVDDGIICSTRNAVDYMKNMIKEDFNITEQGPLRKHLGVQYMYKHDKFGEYCQVQLKKFRTEMMLLECEMLTGKKIKSYVTPGASGKTLGTNNGENIMEAEYRKIVGKL